MRKLLRGSIAVGVVGAAALCAAAAVPALAGGFALSLNVPAGAMQPNVAVSVGQPGFYGQLTIGDMPAPPPVVYSEPVIIERTPAYAEPPIYLHVPPGYERHWREHCAAYHACARRVYFVRDDWYNRVYVPHYREVHGHDYNRDRDGHYRAEEPREHEDRARYRDHDDRDRDHGPSRDWDRGHDH
jgi:hypothetical protein